MVGPALPGRPQMSPRKVLRWQLAAGGRNWKTAAGMPRCAQLDPSASLRAGSRGGRRHWELG